MVRRILIGLLLLLSISASAIAQVPVLVQLGPSGNAATVANAFGGSVVDSIPEANLHLLNLPNFPILSLPTQALLGINFLEADYTVGLPNRGKIGILSIAGKTSSNWYINQPELKRIGAVSALSKSRGRGIIVADINSSVDYGHPALTGHLTSGYDFVSARASYQGTLDQSGATFLDQSGATFLDQSGATFLDQASSTFLNQSGATFIDSSATFLDGNPAYAHGTLCAGIIAAMAPDSIVMPLRVFDSNGNSDVFSITRAIYFAVRNGARVINMSFGMSQSYNSVSAALNFAANAGVIVVASAGNANVSTPQYPASTSNVISVAAVNSADVKASFSNYGSTIDVDAPGVNIISAFPGGYYEMVSGTSFSAPMVAAEAALIMAEKNSGNPMTVINSSTVNISAQNPNYIGQLGYGRINVLSAVK